MSRLTYIVNAYNRPANLHACIASLKAQESGWMRIMVADNCPDARERHYSEVLSKDAGAMYVETWKSTPVNDCYWACDYMAETFTNYGDDFLCFANDNCVYARQFERKMLNAAANADFVACGAVWNAYRAHGEYEIFTPVLDLEKGVHILKPAFIIRREMFLKVGGFRHKENSPGGCSADHGLAIDVLNAGGRCAVVNEPLMIKG